MDKNQIEKALEQMRKELKQTYGKTTLPEDRSIKDLVSYMTEEREKTNKKLDEISKRMAGLETALQTVPEEPRQLSEEIPLSPTDAKIIELVQVKNMVCAEEVMTFMNYKGKNAACARLRRLNVLGVLERLQLGHKVYYKFDAGKATNKTLILSPPQ